MWLHFEAQPDHFYFCKKRKSFVPKNALHSAFDCTNREILKRSRRRCVTQDER